MKGTYSECWNVSKLASTKSGEYSQNQLNLSLYNEAGLFSALVRVKIFH